MTSHAARSATWPSDLLPWADPYIIQLFREASAAEAAGVCQEGRLQSERRGHEPAFVAPRQTTEGWKIVSPPPAARVRKQKTGFGRRLLPC